MGKFEGWFIPADMVDLFQEGRITLKEMVLLAIIDSLVTAKGEGCFASNAYLGKKMCLSRDSIQKMISNLKKQGLVHQVRFDGRRRFLETIKSKIDTRADEYKMDVPSEDEGWEVNEVSSKKNKKRLTRKCDVVLLSDNEEFDRKQATKFRSVLIKHNADLVAPNPPRRPINLHTLQKPITRLRIERNVSKLQIETMLLWLEIHYTDQYTPSIYRVDDFYNKWERFVKVKNNWEIENRKSTPYQEFLDSPEWEAKREIVKAWANNTCERCGNPQATRYHCHHLTYDYGWNCDAKYLQWLCQPCHQFVHDKSDNDPMLVSETDLSEVW